MERSGICYLVGAGPGDPGLITRRGLDCLRRAEILFYDRLVNPELIKQAPADCRRVFVGKKTGQPGLGQEDICRRLVQATVSGAVVVRLKGGDPLVFGRGGEEALALANAGRRFEIVPGVSAGIGAAAYAGVPVTHRGLAAAATLVAGRQRETDGQEDEVDWRKLAAFDHTLCVYMAVERLPHICRELMAGGRPPETPAILVENGTLPEQRCLEGTLASLPEVAAAASAQPPAMLLVGSTVELRQACAWFERRPLSGQSVWLAAPDSRGGEWADAIAEQGADVRLVPAARIEAVKDCDPLSEALLQLAGGQAFDWVAFTSRNGVEHTCTHLRRLGLDARAFARVKLAAVGSATAAALASHGLVADLVPEQPSSAGLLQALATVTNSQASPRRTILLPRSSRAGQDLAEGLRGLGFAVVEAVAYRTRLPTAADADWQSRLRHRPPDAILFSSPSAVAGLRVLLGTPLADLVQEPSCPRLVALGESTAQAMAQASLPCHCTCQRPDAAGLVESLQR